MRVVAFNGSARKGGNTARMVQEVFTELQGLGIETELVQLSGQSVRGCRACYQCKKNADQRCSLKEDFVNDCIGKMIGADAILLASPTYFSSVTTEMKALIDRAGMVSRMNNDLLKRKLGAGIVVARRGGAIHTFDTLNHFFLIGQMIVVGSSYWNLGFGLDPGDVEKDEEAMSVMRTLGQNLAWLLERVRPG
ncbi:MAG: flavodoxin family protein [bacterium]